MDKANFMKQVVFKKEFGGFDYIDCIYKKCRYLDLDNECTGFIIGECIKYEGTYYSGISQGWDGEKDQPELKDRKGVWFYKVATGYNQIELVNRNDAVIQDDKAESIINT